MENLTSKFDPNKMLLLEKHNSYISRHQKLIIILRYIRNLIVYIHKVLNSYLKEH